MSLVAKQTMHKQTKHTEPFFPLWYVDRTVGLVVDGNTGFFTRCDNRSSYLLPFVQSLSVPC